MDLIFLDLISEVLLYFSQKGSLHLFKNTPEDALTTHKGVLGAYIRAFSFRVPLFDAKAPYIVHFACSSHALPK